MSEVRTPKDRPLWGILERRRLTDSGMVTQPSRVPPFHLRFLSQYVNPGSKHVADKSYNLDRKYDSASLTPLL